MKGVNGPQQVGGMSRKARNYPKLPLDCSPTPPRLFPHTARLFPHPARLFPHPSKFQKDPKRFQNEYPKASPNILELE